MKRPQPDLGTVVQGDFIMSAGFNRKIRNYWGTTVLDGVEVINNRLYYYRKDNANIVEENKKGLRHLGVYNDVKNSADPEGVDYAWLSMNKSKAESQNESIDKNFVAENLNKLWQTNGDSRTTDDIKLTTTVVIQELSVKNLLDFSNDIPTLVDVAVNSYESLWNDYKVTQEGLGIIENGVVYNEDLKVNLPSKELLSVDDPWLSAISRYALKDNGVPCTIKNAEVGLTTYNGHVSNTLVLTLEIPYIEVDETTPIVEEIYSDLTKKVKFITDILGSSRVRLPSLINPYITQQEAKSDFDLDGITYSDDGKEIPPRLYTTWNEYIGPDPIFENIWHKSGKHYYIKKAAIDKPSDFGLTHQQLKKYLSSIMDTGYKKKSVPVWKKIVAVIIFVVAVVIAFVSYGAGSEFSSWLIAAAYALVVGSLVLTVLTLVFSAMGMVEMAMAFAWLSAEIEPLVIVASVILVVNSFITAYQKAAEEGFTEYLKQQAIDLVADLAKGIADIVSGNFLTTSAINVTNKVLEAYTRIQNNKLESINDRNKDLKAEYEKLQEENSREVDVMRGFMLVYAKPATADWSMYAGLFDMPYERGGGPMATGNIQKTTKQAIRKADYDDPVFSGIIGL